MIFSITERAFCPDGADLKARNRKQRRKEGKEMKNGKRPTLRQKTLMRSHGYDPEDWLVTKDTAGHLEIVNRASLKQIGRPKVQHIQKET